MRLLLRLESNKDVLQNKENNSKFYSGMHGWIYSKLKGTDFSDVHSEKKFKPFCFSNLFPIKESLIKEGKIYKVIISSPNEMLIIALLSKINTGDILNIGEYSFKIISYSPLPKIQIREGFLLESETLINISVNEDSKIRAVTLSSEPEIFKKNLEKNLIRKYNYFNKEEVDENFNLLMNVNIEEIAKTEVAVKINFIKNDNNWFNVIGSRYKFRLGKLNEVQRKIFQLCYDLGFGERNTFGFGFMNIKNEKNNQELGRKND